MNITMREGQIDDNNNVRAATTTTEEFMYLNIILFICVLSVPRNMTKPFLFVLQNFSFISFFFEINFYLYRPT